jgi:hypothetical protein
LDREGNFRNFLKLRTTVVSPRGVRQDVILEQAGPGRYEAKFETREVGAYLLNLQELDDQGGIRGSQVLGASVNYSPEFNATEPNLPLLRRLAEMGGGKLLDPAIDNPFRLNRLKTFQPRDLWDVLLKVLVCLFLIDVGIRRVDIDREEWAKWFESFKRRLGFGDVRKAVEAEESMSALLARKNEVRAQQSGRQEPVVVLPPKPSADLFKPRQAPTPAAGVGGGSDAGSAAATPGADGSAPAAPAADSGTNRLLEAKRRAQRKR